MLVSLERKKQEFFLKVNGVYLISSSCAKQERYPGEMQTMFHGTYLLYLGTRDL